MRRLISLETLCENYSIIPDNGIFINIMNNKCGINITKEEIIAAYQTELFDYAYGNFDTVDEKPESFNEFRKRLLEEKCIDICQYNIWMDSDTQLIDTIGNYDKLIDTMIETPDRIILYIYPIQTDDISTVNKFLDKFVNNYKSEKIIVETKLEPVYFNNYVADVTVIIVTISKKMYCDYDVDRDREGDLNNFESVVMMNDIDRLLDAMKWFYVDLVLRNSEKLMSNKNVKIDQPMKLLVDRLIADGCYKPISSCSGHSIFDCGMYLMISIEDCDPGFAELLSIESPLFIIESDVLSYNHIRRVTFRARKDILLSNILTRMLKFEIEDFYDIYWENVCRFARELEQLIFSKKRLQWSINN